MNGTVLKISQIMLACSPLMTDRQKILFFRSHHGHTEIRPANNLYYCCWTISKRQRILILMPNKICDGFCCGARHAVSGRSLLSTPIAWITSRPGSMHFTHVYLPLFKVSDRSASW